MDVNFIDPMDPIQRDTISEGKAVDIILRNPQRYMEIFDNLTEISGLSSGFVTWTGSTNDEINSQIEQFIIT